MRKRITREDGNGLSKFYYHRKHCDENHRSEAMYSACLTKEYIQVPIEGFGWVQVEGGEAGYMCTGVPFRG